MLKSIKKNQFGNVLFIILIVVVLFASLSYAVTQSNRGGAANTDQEKAKLDQAVIDNFMAAINSGQMTLTMVRGCNTIIYDPPSIWGNENKNCHMFHIEGAGVAYQDVGLNGCDFSGDIKDLQVGESCGNTVYAGISGGNRIYTTKSNQGNYKWSAGSPYESHTGARSTSDGMSNTNILVARGDSAAPYQAAQICRSLGQDWYLPSSDELTALRNNQNIGELAGTFGAGMYWSSTETQTYGANYLRFNSSAVGTDRNYKNQHKIVRCIRQD